MLEWYRSRIQLVTDCDQTFTLTWPELRITLKSGFTLATGKKTTLRAVLIFNDKIMNHRKCLKCLKYYKHRYGLDSKYKETVSLHRKYSSQLQEEWRNIIFYNHLNLLSTLARVPLASD